jgi:tRNA threonylcarbamoyl adenosine modification protein YeaZ
LPSIDRRYRLGQTADMKILAIDTALGALSAAIVDTAVAAPLAAERILMTRGHAEALVPLIDRIAAQTDGGLDSLDRIAVAVGPGSFTGIRVGIAAARALGLALEIPVVGVSTLAALAAPLILNTGDALVAAALDARHGQVYVQGFDPGGRTLLPPRLSRVREAIRALGWGPFRLTGSGAPMMAIEAWSLGIRAEVTGELVAPDVVVIARLGTLADPASAPPSPLYLKLPDAKPQGDAQILRGST